jgi:hypothetical protein
MRPAPILVVALLAGCAGLDRPGLETYADIRAAISVTTDAAAGITVASSEPAAREEVTIEDIGVDGFDQTGLAGAPLNQQRAHRKVFVLGEKRADGSVSVFIVDRASYPIAETDLQNKPWTETNPDRKGIIGEAWRPAPWELVEYRYECPGSRLNCTRFREDRLRLSADDVQALLVEESEKIRIGVERLKQPFWRLDKDELVAVLDALEATDLFR